MLLTANIVTNKCASKTYIDKRGGAVKNMRNIPPSFQLQHFRRYLRSFEEFESDVPIRFESDGPIRKFRIAAPATFAVVP